MRAQDALQALPGVLVVALLPGLLLLRLLVPSWRWWERVVAAPGVSAGLVGAAGLVDHDLGIPFEVATTAPVLAVLIAATAVVARRRRALLDEGPARASTAAIVAAALVVGGIGVGIAAVGLWSQPLPVADDGAVHATVAENIARTHDVLPVIPVPADGSAFTRPRSGFEATAALVSELGGPTPTAAMVPVALLAVALLPLGLALLAWETTRSARIAVLAPILGAGMALPLFPLAFAEYPYVVDATLVAPLLVALARLVRGAAGRHAALVAVLVSAMWIVHGLEAITAAVIAVPLAISLLASTSHRAAALRRLAVGVVAAVAGAAIVVLLTRLPSLSTAPVLASDAASSEAQRSIASPPHVPADVVLNTFRGADLPGYLGTALLVAGAAAAIVRRRLRWAVVASALLLLALLDSSGNIWMGPLYVRIYPWGLVDRLLGVQYWTTALLLAFGADVLLRGLETLAARLGRIPLRMAGGVALAAVTIAALVIGSRQVAQEFGGVVVDRSRVTPADVAVLSSLRDRLPRGTVVLTDGQDDAGIWVDALTSDLQLLPKPWMQAHPDDWRVVALERACDDPSAASRALAGSAALFVGSKRWSGAVHPWKQECVARVPGLRLVAEVRDGSASAALYRVAGG